MEGTPLSVSNPELAAQASGWDPTTLSAGSHRRVEWRCGHGHVWSANVKDRARGAGCPYCSGNRVLAGFNDLATSNPELAAQASGWDPTTLSAGSHRRVEWRCEHGHVWLSRVDRRSSGGVCPHCTLPKVERPGRTTPRQRPSRDRASEGVRDVDRRGAAAQGHEPRWLYFVEHRGDGTLRVGTCTSSEQEFAARIASEWEIKKFRGPMSAKSAAKIERRITAMLRRRGVEVSSEADADGSHSSWPRKAFPAKSLKKLIKLADDAA